MLAPSEQTCRPDACKRLRLCSPNVMPFFSSIFFAKCTAKSLTVKGFPIRTFIIIATTRWNLNHLFDWHKRNNNKMRVSQNLKYCERILCANTRFVYPKKCESNNSNNNTPRALSDQGLSSFWIFLDFVQKRETVWRATRIDVTNSNFLFKKLRNKNVSVSSIRSPHWSRNYPINYDTIIIASQ